MANEIKRKFYFFATVYAYVALLASILAPNVVGSQITIGEAVLFVSATSVGIVAGHNGMRMAVTYKLKFFHGISFCIWSLFLLMFMLVRISNLL